MNRVRFKERQTEEALGSNGLSLQSFLSTCEQAGISLVQINLTFIFLLVRVQQVFSHLGEKVKISPKYEKGFAR